MTVGIIRFPGSNADWDALHTVRDVLGLDARYVFHKETSLEGIDAVVIPGGFSFGDYLRPGAIATFSPIATALRDLAAHGAPVVGICNGFQVLTELGVLPGALSRNASLKFVCKDIYLRCEVDGFWTRCLGDTPVIRLPIAHADGRYVGAPDADGVIEGRARVAFRYVSHAGVVDEGANPNGSVSNIAGIVNMEGNVLGLMPHPERASEGVLGNDDGRLLLEALKNGGTAFHERAGRGQPNGEKQ